MRVAPKVELTNEQRSTLQAWANGRKTPVRLAERSQIVLFAAEGKRDIDIAAALSITLAKAARWRKRFLRKGLAGLEKDAPRPGRTPAIGKEAVAEIVRRTTQDKPLNATHWSTRSMAAAAGVSDSSILRIWRPWPQATPDRFLQAQQRSRIQRQARSNRWALPCTAGSGHRPMRG